VLFLQDQIRPRHHSTRTSGTVHITCNSTEQEALVCLDTHVGLNVVRRFCDVYPDKCWFVVLCRFWHHCSRTFRPRRLTWSQNRHNTTNQHLSGHTSPDTCGYILCDMSVQTYCYCSYSITEPVGLFARSFHFRTALWNICYV